MRERDYAGRLRQYLPPPTLIQRIETFAGSGVPDIYVCNYGKAFWVEAKIGLYSRRNQTIRVPRNKLRPVQKAWMVNHRRSGGESFIGILSNDNHMFLVKFSVELWDRLADGVDIAELRMRNVLGEPDRRRLQVQDRTVRSPTRSILVGPGKSIPRSIDGTRYGEE